MSDHLRASCHTFPSFPCPPGLPVVAHAPVSIWHSSQHPGIIHNAVLPLPPNPDTSCCFYLDNTFRIHLFHSMSHPSSWDLNPFLLHQLILLHLPKRNFRNTIGSHPSLARNLSVAHSLLLVYRPRSSTLPPRPCVTQPLLTFPRPSTPALLLIGRKKGTTGKHG